MKNILDEENINCNIWDPYLDCNLDEAIDKFSWKKPNLFFIGTKHEVFNEFPFPKGSTVIDPWRYIGNKEGVKIIRVGNSIDNNS